MAVAVDCHWRFFDKHCQAGLYFFDILPVSYPGCAQAVSMETESAEFAAGSGNISNELTRGEVVTTCGIDVTFSCSSGDRDHWLHSLALC